MRKLLIIPILFLCLAGHSQTWVEDDTSIVDIVTGSQTLYVVPEGSAVIAKFLSSLIQFRQAGGYVFTIGADVSDDANYGNLDGALVSGNKFYYDNWPTGVGAAFHGYFTRGNRNINTRLNYFDEIPDLALIAKASQEMITNIWDAGGFNNNIFRNPGYLSNKAVTGLRIYNNTFYKSRNDGNYFISVVNNPDPGQSEPYMEADSVKIKNNIFVSTGNDSIVLRIFRSCIEGLEMDHNIYWFENTVGNTPYFRVTTISPFSDSIFNLIEWQARGYDLNSFIRNPDFVDTTNLVPQADITIGTDLGPDYEYGLDPISEWVVGTMPDSVQQWDDWQVGAVIIPEDVDLSGKFVSYDNGDNSNDAAINRPWKDIEYTMHNADPGDIVYFRGDTFLTTVTDGTGIKIDPQNGTGNNGEAGNWIQYRNYPGEIPIFDFSGSLATAVFNYGVRVDSAEFLHFKGLEMITIQQGVDTDDIVFGFNIEKSTDSIKVEQLVMHDIGGVGLRNRDNIWIEIWNSDIYDVADDYGASPGDYGTGFSNSSSETFTTGYTYIHDCRAWEISDNGFTSSTSAFNHFERCWTWGNGYELVEPSIGGVGFKLGYWGVVSTKDSVIFMANCIAAENLRDGFAGNESSGDFVGPYKLYNNLSVGNLRFGYAINNTGDTEANELKRTLRNNSALGNGINMNAEGSYTHSNNTWDGGGTATVEDYVSLLTSQLILPRKLDGSLPDVTFGTLVSDSDLKDAGIPVGLPYNGSNPDIAWEEFSPDTLYKVGVKDAKILYDKNGNPLKFN